jgi:hypothetical protein
VLGVARLERPPLGCGADRARGRRVRGASPHVTVQGRSLMAAVVELLPLFCAATFCAARVFTVQGCSTFVSRCHVPCAAGHVGPRLFGANTGYRDALCWQRALR